MRVRKFLAGAATSAVAVSVLALTGSPAFAANSTDPQPDDTNQTTPPTADMLVGGGSDTTQHVVKLVGDAFNATNPAAKIFTYAACATPTTCGNVTLPDGSTIVRPNGSGGGKTLLYGSGNNTNFDFARSSSALNDAEVAGNLYAFPFALDTLVMATSKTAATNAPASISIGDIVKIYDGTYTKWNQLPGGTSSADIVPMVPQPKSGTRDFFLGQLKAANGGVDVTLAGSVQVVQEHDPTPIQSNANAIAPFSQGRALIAGTVTVEQGWSANRAVYNVIRQSDLNNGQVLAAFGTNGYFCSPAAKPFIEEAGFKQLRAPAQGGACGAPTQTPTSNFAVDAVQTSTGVTVSSASASSAKVVAKVSASTAPSGSVTFYEGAAVVASNVPLVSGQATATPAAAPGLHTYRAVYTPAQNSAFLSSQGTGSGTVQKASSTTSADFPSKAVKGKKVKGTVTVKLTGASVSATGTVTVKLGSKTVGTGTLSNGKVTLKLKGLKVGKNKLTATWAGDANGNGSSVVFKVKVTKPKPKN